MRKKRNHMEEVVECAVGRQRGKIGGYFERRIALV